MNISFWLTSTTRTVNKDNWGKLPMGGAEISAVNLGIELLELGHTVQFFLQRAEPFDKDNLHVRRHDQVFDEKLEYFICVRPHPILSGDFGSIKKILWSGDAFDQPSNDIFYNENTAKSMDGFVFKTNWQKEKILDKYYTINPEQVTVISNGFSKKNFDENVLKNIDRNDFNFAGKRFIHASTWYRGLANFIDIWPMIREEMPFAEIHIFSKTTLYSEINPRDMEGYYKIAEELVLLPGVVLREPVPQYIIAQEMKKAWLMLYPNSGFVESSCGSVLQSMAVGTPVVATKRAGLVETIGGAGVLIDQNDENWKRNFARETISLCNDPIRYKALKDLGLQETAKRTWPIQAKVWENYLKSL